MARRRYRMRPSKGMITFSRIFGAVFALIALIMLITVVNTVHSGMGLAPAVMLAAFIVLGIFIACNKRGSYFAYEWQVEEEGEEGLETPVFPTGSVEARLKQLQGLYDQRLISPEEYEEKRKEILKDI